MYNEVNKNKKYIILSVIVFLIITIVAVIIGIKKSTPTTQISDVKTEVTILVVPTTASIAINNQPYENGTYEVLPGEYNATISATGFTSKDVKFTVEEGKITLLYDYLTPTTGSYTNEDYDLLRYISKDEETDNLIMKHFENLAFLDLLPIINEDKKIYITDQSYSEKCNKEPYVCIGITNLGSLSQADAIDMLREKNYNPDDFVIFYEEGTSEYYDGE